MGNIVHEEVHGISREDVAGSRTGEDGVMHIFLHPDGDLIGAVSAQFVRPQPSYPHNPVNSPSFAQCVLEVSQAM